MTESNPPKVVLPEEIVRLLDPVTVVLPLSETLPEPVEKVPVPDWVILPNDWEILLAKEEVPVTDKVDERVVAPVTPKVPPSEVAPELTVKGLVPVTEVGPFKETAPVPVEKVPPPCWVKLPEVWLILPLNVPVLVTEREFKVANPEVDRVESEELPVTPKVPPMVWLPVTDRLPPKEPEPETVKSLDKVVLPVTERVDATEVGPFKETLPDPVVNDELPF